MKCPLCDGTGDHFGIRIVSGVVFIDGRRLHIGKGTETNIIRQLLEGEFSISTQSELNRISDIRRALLRTPYRIRSRRKQLEGRHFHYIYYLVRLGDPLDPSASAERSKNLHS